VPSTDRKSWQSCMSGICEPARYKCRAPHRQRRLREAPLTAALMRPPIAHSDRIVLSRPECLAQPRTARLAVTTLKDQAARQRNRASPMSHNGTMSSPMSHSHRPHHRLAALHTTTIDRSIPCGQTPCELTSMPASTTHPHEEGMIGILLRRRPHLHSRLRTAW
jgi:hypothetical protein